MALEAINTAGPICCKCGQMYSRRKGYFPASYAVLHKGIGYIPVCKNCIDQMYSDYLNECEDTRSAVHQMCRKLDIYWNDTLYDRVEKKNVSNNMMTGYLRMMASTSLAGRSYDDTLRENMTLWEFAKNENSVNAGVRNAQMAARQASADSDTEQQEEDIDVPEEVIAFWGTGLTSVMYLELEQRRGYWMSRFPKNADLGVGTEALIRQICMLELQINQDRAAGKSIDKNINALNNLLGSAQLKPAQKNDEADAALERTPFGVWIDRWENKRPIPDPDPDFQDVDGIIRYIQIWFLGHISHMLGLKNCYCKLYEDEVAKLRLEHPEYDEEDDETMIDDIFGEHEV